MNHEIIGKKAQEFIDEIIDLRHYLHTNPEISWEEYETSKLIKSKLEELGLTNIRLGFGGRETGVTADLTVDPGAPTVALRADIDALAMSEDNEQLSYRSCRNGAMHACGHDGHIAAMIGVAKVLASLKGNLPGNVRFIFQPAEEHGARSGAREMIKEGVLEGVGAIGALHLWSFIPTGLVQWKTGALMASSDSWTARFIGQGGHGAMPHSAIDPTVAAAGFIGALQTIVSREINPVDTAVVSLGRMTAGDVFNVIPETADLLGTIRTFNPEVRNKMEERIRRIADGIAAAYRCRAEAEVARMYPPVINHKGPSELLRDCAIAIVGADNVAESPLYMVSEDYSYFLDEIPGTFFFLGCGKAEKGTNHPHHSPKFNIDDDSLVIGITLLATYAVEAIKKLKSGGFA